VNVSDVRKVAVVGTGLMGHGIAQAFALAGYPVALYDAESGRAKQAIARIRSNLDLFIAREVATAAEAEAAMGRLRAGETLAETAGDADFVMEAVFEDLEVKKQVMREIDAVAPARTVLASNTSGLDVNQFGPATKRPDRVITAHFSNPPHIIPVVEVVKGEQTSEETLQLTVDILRRIGKHPVVIRHHIPGFIWNRLQYAMFREAIGLVQKGVASPEDIDTVIEMGLGRRYTTVGPLKTGDINGLALFHQISKYLYQELDDARGPHPVHSQLVEAGHIGVKSGRGFFDWAEGKAEAAIKRRDEELIRWYKVDQAERKQG
jgi:3-hydroxybutyryl-CoA dehydrogenase